MKNKWLKLAGITMAVAGLSMAVQATSINGSVAFSGGASVDNPLNLGAATQFTSITAIVTPTTQFGNYTALANGLAVTFTPFKFNPPAANVIPLWTVTVGTITYSFAATSVTSFWDGARSQWDLGGNGIASITGFTDTAGTWNATVGVQGQSFFFGSASATGIPDGGSTVMLLGAALSALGLFRKKLIA